MTSEELYETLMAGYVPNPNLRMLDNSAQIFMQRKKALEDARKKQKDFTKQKDVIIPPKKPTTTKPGTGGGGFTPTTTAQNIARTASRVDPSGNVKAYGLAKGGLARMLGE
jgi:hypothetical protein